MKIITKCLEPYNISPSIINLNLDHALHGFRQEMRSEFETFIKSSPQDMKPVFFQILLKHFVISINSDKEFAQNEQFEQITGEIENLIE